METMNQEQEEGRRLKMQLQQYSAKDPVVSSISGKVLLHSSTTKESTEKGEKQC